jgi:hypothetical protein
MQLIILDKKTAPIKIDILAGNVAFKFKKFQAFLYPTHLKKDTSILCVLQIEHGSNFKAIVLS